MPNDDDYKDSSQIIEELNIRKDGLKDGLANIPASTAAAMNKSQQEIITHYDTRIRALITATGEKVANIRKRLSEKNFDETFDQAKRFHSDALSEVRKITDKHKSKLENLAKVKSDADRGLRFFKAYNNLNKQAHYPDSFLLHWALVFIMIVVESAFNSYFFAQGSDLGLLGGFFEAVFVSVANIGAALVAGYFWRFINKQETADKLKAYATITLYFIFFIIFNLGVAHYRAMLELNPEIAFQQAIINLFTWPNTYQINNFDAWILFTIGVLLSWVAFIKSYTADDVFPGYGREDRKFREALKNFNQEVEKDRAEMHATLDAMKDSLQRNVHECRTITREYPQLISDIESTIRKSENNHSRLKSDCTLVLKTYRDFNSKARSSPTPSYWDEYEDLTQDANHEEMQPTDLERQFGNDIAEKLKSIEHTYEETMQEFANTTNAAADSFNDYISQIEKDSHEKDSSNGRK